MAEPSHHEHHDPDAVHVHVHSWKFYATILSALLFLTIITVAASTVDIDGFLALGNEVQGVGTWNLLVAVLIATTKATLVVLFFMHLKDDSRFNAVVFVGALLFVGVFFAYTMNDTAVRGTMDRYNGVHVDPDTGARAPGGLPAPIPGEALEPGWPRPAAAAPAETGAAPHEAAPAEAPAEEAPAPAAAPDAAAAAADAAVPAAEEPAAAEPAAEEPPAPAEAAPAEPTERPRRPRPARPTRPTAPTR
jgi:cytochrome c oxidase subunit IV